MTTAPATSKLVLDEQLCFAINAASRAMTRRYRPLLEDLGITYPQYLVLLVLWEGPSVTVGELGSRLQLDSGTLSPLLKRMQASGLITRDRRPGDERTVEVGATAAGAQLRERAEEFPTEIQCAAGLSDDELGALRQQLVELARRLE